MDVSTGTIENIDKAATLKSCLVYLLKDAKEAELGWCALHLKIAISELNCVIGEGQNGASSRKDVSLRGQPAVNRSSS